MTTARNFLADNNLAIRGARGRFSREAIAALKAACEQGITFSDYTPPTDVIVKRRAVTKAKAHMATHFVRDETRIRIIGNDGISIHVDHCNACGNSVRRCPCTDGPRVSRFLARDTQSITLV